MVFDRKTYDRLRWQQRREDLVQIAGGTCVRCGSTEDLEFDHVDPATKSFSVGKGLFKSWATLLAEVAKCQLLCKPCHDLKTTEDNLREFPHGGGVSGKKHCKCEPCTQKRAQYYKEYRNKNKAGSSNDRASLLQSDDQGLIP